MDVIKENTIKFIDALIVDNYKSAHKFLEVIVNEKVKRKIGRAVKTQEPFGKKKKLKENFQTDLKGGTTINLNHYLNNDLKNALVDFENYHGGESTHMFKVRQSDLIKIEDLPSLQDEVKSAIKEAKRRKQVQHEKNFISLSDELETLINRFKNVIHQTEDEEQMIGRTPLTTPSI
jgi:hypothetical protein